MQPRFTVCGGCHIDRQLRFESPPLPGRTAPASQSERVGGVATNIAVRLAAWNAQTRLAGVQPPQSLDAMKARLPMPGSIRFCCRLTVSRQAIRRFSVRTGNC